MPEVNREARQGGRKHTAVDVRRWFNDGIPMADAIRIAVGGSLPKFVLRNQLGTSRQNTAAMVAGRRRPSDDVVEALARELDSTPVEVRELLWLGQRPGDLAAAS